MHPIAHKRPPAAGWLDLRYFTFVMRKTEICPTAMYVDDIPQESGGHAGTLDMPARSPRPPRAIPGRLTWRLSLPEHKIQRIAFKRIVRMIAAFIREDIWIAIGAAEAGRTSVAWVGTLYHRICLLIDFSGDIPSTWVGMSLIMLR